MLRISDCPADSVRNRVGIVDVRLLSDHVPAHSDMLMWNINDSVENAALQIINVIFGVPQISMLIDKLPQDHYKMLKFYLDFWNDNKDILLNGELIAKNPECNYSFISCEKSNKIIAAAYATNVMTISKNYDDITLLNGTAGKKLILDLEANIETYNYKIYDCMGNVIKSSTLNSDLGINKFEVPLSGMVRLEKMKNI